MKWKIATAVASFAALMACASPAASDPNGPQKIYGEDTVAVTKVARVNGVDMWKFCDGLNLIYLSDSYKGNAIAVVREARECAK